jgi:hypothetical protein
MQEDRIIIVAYRATYILQRKCDIGRPSRWEHKCDMCVSERTSGGSRCGLNEDGREGEVLSEWEVKETWSGSCQTVSYSYTRPVSLSETYLRMCIR